MKEYKGVGDKIQIDGDKLYIKSSIISLNCYLAHIEWIKLGNVNFQGRGVLRIMTDDKSYTYQIVFKKNQYDIMKEAYEFLLPYTRRMIVDEENKKITVLNKGNKDKTQRPRKRINVSKPYSYISFDDINSFEVVSDIPQIINSNVFTDTAGGKYVAGSAGAIAGALSSLGNGTFMSKLYIKINLKSFDKPCIYLKYITRKTEINNECGRFLINMFQKDLSILEHIVKSNSKQDKQSKDSMQKTSKTIKNVSNKSNIPVEELKQLKELLDSGIITQEEFDAKKKQLLGL